MKTVAALILMTVGTAMMLGGFAWAVWEFAQMYGGTLDDPMNDAVETKRTSDHMLQAAMIGGIGFVPATLGSVMLGKGLVGRITRRVQGRPPR